MKLLIASSNTNKISEIRNKISSEIELLGLKDLEITEEIPETSDTIEGNAIQKVQYLHKLKGLNCFADDTGLEVEALNGEPGIYSARYAGPQRNSEGNMAKVLANLKDKENKNARFKTVIALIYNNVEHVFEGITNGVIVADKRGKDGFGYDPIFQPIGYDKTYAEMSMIEKNKISHRAKAVDKLISFLKEKVK